MMSLDKKTMGVAGAGALLVLVFFFLYSAEVQKNNSLRATSQKTIAAAQDEIKKLQTEAVRENEKKLSETRKLLDQVNQCAREKDKAVLQLAETNRFLTQEQEASRLAREEADRFRAEASRLRKEKDEKAAGLQKSLKKKIRTYEARILSLEAALDKAQKTLQREGARYHYNLGVLYAQDKEFDSAVTEFKAALAYNPDHVDTHYNLGIIFDDYFKDRQNAEIYYRRFLELAPKSDDAEAVREWLAGLKK